MMQNMIPFSVVSDDDFFFQDGFFSSDDELDEVPIPMAMQVMIEVLWLADEFMNGSMMKI